VRKAFGTSIGNNAVHGSDSVEASLRELALFFGGSEQDDEDEECDVEYEFDEEGEN
jgi:hypothetical protein